MQPDSFNYFEHDVYISNGKDVSIGKCCHINEHVFIQGANIGNHVMIAPYVVLLSKTHVHADKQTPMILQGESETQIPIIEDDVWIGRNAMIMPGVRVGTGSIVGAGAVVTRDVEPFSVVGGIPARLIRYR